MKRELFIAALSAVLMLGVGQVSGASADERQRLDAAASALNTLEAKHANHQVLYERIAAETGVSVETLHKQHTDTGLGAGSLLAAHQIAKASGRAFADVAADFKAGKTSGQIAGEANVQVSAMTKAAQRVESKAADEYRDMQKRAEREKKDVERRINELNDSAKKREAAAYARISAQTGVAVETLRKQKEDNGLDFGGLFMAAHISQASGKSFADVAAQAKAGKSWGEIAGENNVKVGSMVDSAAKVNTAVQRDNGAVNAQGSVQGSGKAGVEQGGNRATGSAGASGNAGASGTVNRPPPPAPVAPPVRVPVVPVVPVTPRK